MLKSQTQAPGVGEAEETLFSTWKDEGRQGPLAQTTLPHTLPASVSPSDPLLTQHHLSYSLAERREGVP